MLFTESAKRTLAADNFWDGSFSDSWNITANWHFTGPITPLPRVPSDIDTAVLASPVNDNVRLYGNTAPINGLIVGNTINLFTNGFFGESTMRATPSPR